MRDGDGRAALRKSFECSRHAHFGHRIDRRRGLIENQYVGICNTGSQQRHELALARRQLVAALAHFGEQSVRQGIEPIVEVERRDRSLKVRQRPARHRKHKVGGNGVVEEEGLLGHHHESVAQICICDLRERNATESDLPRDRVGKSGHQTPKCRLARSGGPHQGHLLARRNGHRYADQYRLIGIDFPSHAIAKRDITNVDGQRAIGK